MKSDAQLQKDVQKEISLSPILKASGIGVTAQDGVVTLSGVVDSFSKKRAAADAAKRVSGIKAVAEEIKVKYDDDGKRNDTEIAVSALDALKANGDIRNAGIIVEVENGWVTLSGKTEWNFQKVAARESIELLTGVCGVSNNITVRSDPYSPVRSHPLKNNSIY